MKGIEKCRACGSKRVRQFFDLGDQPFANALLHHIELNNEKRYPLSLSFCEDCSLVQLDYTADPKELFSNYFWVTGTSSTAKNYAKIFFDMAVDHHRIDKNGYVMEIASNDGTFLRPFSEGGYRVLGVDPAENIARRASESGIRTEVAFFGSKTARDIVSREGYPEVLFARNVLPHVADTNDFVEGLSYCCGDETLAIVEVHHAGAIADELHYDSIYHEHLCYFTLQSVEKLLLAHGLYAYDVSFSPISGGSIVLFLRKRELPVSKSLIELRGKENTKGYNGSKCWNDFAVRAYEHRKVLREKVEEYSASGCRVIGYGASARSSTLLNFAGINNELIECIIDKNEMKHGRLTPGTHIPIVGPDEGMNRNPDVIVLLAWNFKDEIIEYLKSRYGYHGKLIVPLPFSVKVVDL